jgi:hypothetical protein
VERLPLARTANPFTLTVVDSNTSDWDDNLSSALSDWSTRQTVMDVARGTADDSTRARKQCRMVRGQIRSCNAAYGFNGWLGLASINISGGHITHGTAKMNDSYFNSGSYDETARQHVMCQEIGHDFGLDHQDESGADLNACMDYSTSSTTRARTTTTTRRLDPARRPPRRSTLGSAQGATRAR